MRSLSGPVLAYLDRWAKDENIVPTIAVILATLISPSSLCAEAWQDAGPAFRVHGRLSIQRNGAIAPRIWIVGTKRVLGVPPTVGNAPVYLPEPLNRIAWDNYVFGDFIVVPFTKDEPGVMRIVRVVSAENIVVTDWDLKFLYRITGRFEE